MKHEKLWKNCLSFIKDNIDKMLYETWFEPITAVKFEQNILQLRVPSQFFYEYIEENFIHLLSTALKREFGDQVRLEYKVLVDSSNESITPISTVLPTQNKSYSANNRTGDNIVPKTIQNPFKAPEVGKKEIDPNLNSSYTFGNYVEGECNRFVTTVAKSISENPGSSSFNPLFIHGKSGVGKTHICQAVGHKVLELYPDKTVLYVPANTFYTQYAQASKANNVNSFIYFYEQIDVLILDDVHDLLSKPKSQDIFFHIFNHLYNQKKQVIITSDRPSAELQGLNERLASRCMAGLAVKIDLPDYATRCEILKFKLYSDGIELEESLITYISQRLKTSVREMEGFYISLIAHATYSNKKIDAQLIDELLGHFVVQQTAKEISMEIIRKQVADFYKLTIEEINSNSRKRNIVQARQICMALCKHHTNTSLQQIGDNFGKRAHATVLHALKAVENLIQTNELVKYEYNKIKEQIGIVH